MGHRHCWLTARPELPRVRYCRHGEAHVKSVAERVQGWDKGPAAERAPLRDKVWLTQRRVMYPRWCR